MLALAPDAASAKAGRGQASPAKWPESGASALAVWGSCQGSGAKPYQVCVELDGPAFRCSCPSRKFPCKHALGVLLLWAAGTVAEAGQPAWVDTWLAERAARSERSEQRATTAKRDPEAAAKRADRRADRVSSGVAELGEWLADRVHGGLRSLEQSGASALHTVAARMVDAQAPGLASGLRRAAVAAGRGQDWPSRLLEELALLHLLVVAWTRRDELPEPLADTVRTRLGLHSDTADVLAHGEQVVDTWLVTGLVDTENEGLLSRRVWLRGLGTGRCALVLSFAGPGRSLDGSLLPGSLVPASLAFYPGSLPLRAIVAERGDPLVAPCPPGESVLAALAGYAEALAADPWLDRWPVLLADVVPAVHGDAIALSDVAGDALPLADGVDPWALCAVSAGRPITVAAEWSVRGLRPLSCWDGDRPVRL